MWCIDTAHASFTSRLVSRLYLCIIVTRCGKALDCTTVTSLSNLSDRALVFGEVPRFVMYFSTAARLYYKTNEYF